MLKEIRINQINDISRTIPSPVFRTKNMHNLEIETGCGTIQIRLMTSDDRIVVETKELEHRFDIEILDRGCIILQIK